MPHPLPAVWKPGQLEEEIKRGFWYPVAASTKVILKPATFVADMSPDDEAPPPPTDILEADLADSDFPAASDGPLDSLDEDRWSLDAASGHSRERSEIASLVQDRCSDLHTELSHLVGLSH